MKIGWRDAVATALFAVIAVTYGFYLALGGISLIQDANGVTTFGLLDPTGMSAFALVLGIVAAAVGGWIVFAGSATARYVTGGLGLLSAALGVLALIGENIFTNATLWESVLAAFIGSIVLLWGIAIGRHSGVLRAGETQHPAGMTHA